MGIGHAGPRADYLAVAVRLCLLVTYSLGSHAQRSALSPGSTSGTRIAQSCIELRHMMTATTAFEDKIFVAGTIECKTGRWASSVFIDRPITVEGVSDRGGPQAIVDWGDLQGGILLGQGAVIVFRNLVLVQDAWNTEGTSISVFDWKNDTGSKRIELQGVAILARSCSGSRMQTYELSSRNNRRFFRGRLNWLPYRGVKPVNTAVQALAPSAKVNDNGIMISMCKTGIICEVGSHPVTELLEIYRKNFSNEFHQSQLAPESPKPPIKTAGFSIVSTAVVAAAVAFGFGVVFFQKVARWALRCSGGCGGYERGTGMASDGNENLNSLCIDVASLTDEAQEPEGMNGVELAEIQLGSPLGRGGFGRVYKGFFNNMIVAVKVIEHDGNLMRGEGEPLEALLSMHVDHPNVVKTFLKQTRGRNSFDNSVGGDTNYCAGRCIEHGMNKPSNADSANSEVSDEVEDLDDFSYIEKNLRAVGHMDDWNNFRTWIVMEYCDKGSLANAVRTRAFFYDQDDTQPNVLAMLLTALDIASAMEYLHSLKVIHGDLKAQNVLLKSSPIDKRGFYCKVGDFGLSRVILHNTHIETFTCGTVRYMPPELLKDGLMTPAVDVYSYGMMMFELVSGHKPYPGKHHSDIVVSVVHGKRPSIPQHCPREFAMLIQDCWCQDHTKRPSFARILEELRIIAASYNSPVSRSLSGNRKREGHSFPHNQASFKSVSTEPVRAHSSKSIGLCPPRIGLAGKLPSLVVLLLSLHIYIFFSA